jgi:hypothetical protein
MSKLKAETKYCSFLDVLGYKDIVESNETTIEEKVKMLTSIYMNLFSSISSQIKIIQSNLALEEKLYIKSFSDCVYIEAKEPKSLLFTLHNIFNVAFGYNSNFSQKNEYTPMLRSGTVKDWTMHFMDIGSITRQPIDKIYMNDEHNNPVGLGVARAYLTSEKTGLKGMRIIISKEVLDDLNLLKFDRVSFECFYIECDNLLKHDSLPKTLNSVKLFLAKTDGTDKEGNPIPLYELYWPVYSYSWSQNNSDIHTMIEEFFKMSVNFVPKEMPHYKSTAELLLKSLLITVALYPDEYKTEEVKTVITELQKISETKHDLI